jgi:hypothetical protein
MNRIENAINEALGWFYLIEKIFLGGFINKNRLINIWERN